MQTEACRVWDVDLGSFAVSLTFGWTSLKFENCLQCFPHVNNLSLCRMMDSKVWKWPYNNCCFSKIIADVFPPGHCINSHLNAPDQQTHICWWSVNQLYLISGSWWLFTFIPVEAVSVYLSFSQTTSAFWMCLYEMNNDTVPYVWLLFIIGSICLIQDIRVRSFWF